MVERFPNIKLAVLRVAYDNGAVDRYRSVEDVLQELESLLSADGVYEGDLVAIDTFLGTLTARELDTVCCGEASESKAITRRGPHREGVVDLTSGLLDAVVG